MLRPARPAAREHVDGAAPGRAVVGLRAVRAALASPVAPTARACAEIATLAPNASPAPVFDAFTYACWVQVVPARANT
ncbi:hypothetical protein BE21_26605 [Sorangium cellulosum]|uniref:Uncharacterized protein n=1 Tax=Sorangium cellulosum TaxID=56 RepID=A0A150TTE4_SORCE|nr:hypothetical protein BE21_26605 [Sorangium cellulosum]